MARELRLDGSRKSLDDAKKLVANEFKLDPEKFTDEKYLQWFARSLGKSLALIHKNGYIHRNMSTHNVTADGRIVDFDSVKRVIQESQAVGSSGDSSFRRTPIGQKDFQKSQREDFDGAASLIKDILVRSVLDSTSQSKDVSKKILEASQKIFEESYKETLSRGTL